VSPAAKYVWAALAIAVLSHFAFLHAAPRVLMNAAIERVGAGGANAWRVADRVTALSRDIVRPSPDFAYSVCVYDLRDGPLALRAAPWGAYWSLSLYGQNSDNYFVVDDREARDGAEITLVRAGRPAPEDAPRVVESPSRRGIALIRRLAPTLDDYNAASRAAQDDVCAAFTPAPTS
jgi:uncharacterized membrane protein